MALVLKNSSDQTVELFDESEGRLYVIAAGEEIEFVDEVGNRLLSLEDAQKLTSTKTAKPQEKAPEQNQPKTDASAALG